MRRLNTVGGSDYTKEGFYAIVVRNAGRELASIGVVTILVNAIAAYTENRSDAMAAVLEAQLPNFIRVLIDDEEVKREAMNVLESL